MRADEDFMVYVGARWPRLLRTLVLLGCPPGEAAYVATAALSRSRRSWADERSHGDVDRLVQDELEAAWARQRARTPAQETPRDEAGRQELAEQMTIFAAPTLEELRGHERRRRRATSRRSLAVLVPVVLVVAGVTWWATRSQEHPPSAELRPVSATQAENPAGVAWYAEGRLHLAHVVLPLPGLRDVVATGAGAVYGDSLGRVVRVAEDGARRALGLKEPSGSLVGSDGWVVWVDQTGRTPELRVYDADAGDLIGALALTGPAAALVRPLAVDDGTVFYTDPEGTRAWRPAEGMGRSDVVEPAQLLDASARTRAYQVSGDEIRVEQPFLGIAFDLAGTGAELSDDGGYTLTRTGVVRDGIRPVAVYRTRTGEQVPSGIDDRFEIAIAARLGPDGRVTYVVGKAVPETAPGFVRTKPSGQLELRSCVLATGACESVAGFPPTGPALLAD